MRQLHTSVRLMAEQEGPSKAGQASRLASLQLPRHDIEVGPTQQNRYEEHYNNALARDLLYMTYDHTLDTSDPNAVDAKKNRVQRTWDPSSPYSKNRPARPNKGNRLLVPSAANYADEVVEIDRIVITSFSKDAITNKQALIPLVAMMRAITGKPVVEAMADPAVVAGRAKSKMPKTGYVRIVHAKSNVASFKLRRGAPVGVQAVLPSKSAYRFLEVLSTFVLPRLRSFNGFPLPPASQSDSSPAAVSGTVSIGMGPEALGLFPQTEVNWDSYPSKAPGFQVST